MNLSPTWVSKLKKHGVDATHWSEIEKALAGHQRTGKSYLMTRIMAALQFSNP